MDVETSLRFAQAAAALVATGLGSDAGIISFHDTLHAMHTLTDRQGRRQSEGLLLSSFEKR
jgi:hypothetical protein